MNECSAYVGLDVHKDTIAVAVALPGRGEPVYRGEVKNQRNRSSGRTSRTLARVSRAIAHSGVPALGSIPASNPVHPSACSS